MNQQQLKAYLNLIQGLLSCPKGEEWILLRENEELVNAELVAVMEQVANHLAREGDIKAAKYLHNWAGKLYHIITESSSINPEESNDKTQAYLELIQALLNSPPGSQTEILAANQDLIGPDLVKLMQEVANQLEIDGNLEKANFLHNLALDLNRSWLKTHEFQPTFKPEITPDPWLEEDEQTSTSETQPANSATSTTASQEPTSQIQPEIPAQLNAIANAVISLEKTLTPRNQQSNPLWYMDVLQKAAAGNWILTTKEVQQLIGTKPRCRRAETTYYRGSWIFIKAGKIGAQTGWRVKENPSENV
ncbi:MAG: hypothetical protein D6756_07125 [Cyanobacteria bacterium J083]|nr:MAG: hypothetical protein D6756_07125 [Cyanobacteria bacterium J083]